ncbi:MAG TPA: amino acid permease [Usitatibacteraceae bacterium]|nr:amino acid permease [Usitatibacteraceae bacterium]
MSAPSLGEQLLRKKPQGKDEQAGSEKLERTLGVFSLAMLGVGATIGTGIFFALAEAVPKAGPSVILSFVIAAVTAGLTALCYAELAARISGSGSSYTFVYATIGEFVAYVVAACLLLEYGLAGSATAIGWSAYLNNFLDNAFGWQIPEWLRSPMIVDAKNGVEFHFDRFNLPPVVLVALCGILLLRGVRESVGVNTVMVLVKIAILVFFAGVAFTGFSSENLAPFFNTDNSKGHAGMAGVTAAAATVFFSFIGLDTVATGGAEAKNPQRDVPLAILVALLTVTFCYLLVAVAAVGAQPAARFEGQEAGLAVILKDVTGLTWPSIVLSLGAVISVFSVTLASIYGQTRILYAVSRDGLVGRAFSQVDAKSHAPVVNTVIVCLIVGLIAGTVDSGFLWDMVSMGTLVAFAVVSAAIPVVRRMQLGRTGGFRVPFGPWAIPLASIASCLYIMKDLSRNTFAVFGVWMTLAVVAYFLWGRRNSKLNPAPA